MSDNDDRTFPARPIVGVGAIVLGANGVLLIQRGKPPRVGSWSLPGGAQEVGETVFEAARREIQEETGLVVEVQSIVDVVDSITRSDDGGVEYHYTLIDVLAIAPANAQVVAGGDAAAVAWADMEDLSRILFGLRPSVSSEKPTRCGGPCLSARGTTSKRNCRQVSADTRKGFSCRS